jgi:uncharacterized protein YukE
MRIQILTKKKEKESEEEKRELKEQRQFVDRNIDSANKTLEESKNTQKGNLEVGRELVKLVEENKEKENILLAREQNIKISEDDIEERKKNIRKEEIFIETHKSDIRKREQEVSENEKDVKEREVEAQKLKSESEEAKEKYQTLFDELEEQKENIDNLEKEAKRKNDSAVEKENSANAIFEKAKTIDDEIKVKEAEFEAKIGEIESSLKAKIEEYDRKLEDINNTQEFIDNIKFDDSEDGKAAKIVVKEAIRQAKKSLSEIKNQFDELDEKYCGGTFKGFSTPISEIDKSFEELKAQYQQIKEHIEANADLPKSVNNWLDSIEDYIDKADKNNKSWEFSEAYRNIIFGLSTCKNYELLLNILNEWGNSGAGNEDEYTQSKDFTDWYEILEVDPDSTEKEIKKQYKNLAKKYHPDTAMDDEEKKECEDRMRLINEAWSILKDDEKRKKFDEERKKRKS